MTVSLAVYLGPCCRTEVTAATRCVAPPTLEAAVNSSFMCTSACCLVVPRRHRTCAADRKLSHDTWKSFYSGFLKWSRVCECDKQGFNGFKMVAHSQYIYAFVNELFKFDEELRIRIDKHYCQWMQTNFVNEMAKAFLALFDTRFELVIDSVYQ